MQREYWVIYDEDRKLLVGAIIDGVDCVAYSSKTEAQKVFDLLLVENKTVLTIIPVTLHKGAK